MKLLTNNPLVANSQEFPSNVEVEFIDTDYLGVLQAVYKAVIDGKYCLLTHPLSSSLKPNETYYKSILLQDRNSQYIDMESLEMIESSIASTEKFLKSKKTPDWPDHVLSEFQTIDYSIIQGAFEHSEFGDYILNKDDR